MFGLKLFTIFSLLLWGLFLLIAVRVDTPLSRGFRIRIVSLLGFVLVGCGFFFQPWIKLSFLDYLDLTPKFLNQFFSGGILEKLIDLVGVHWLSKLVEVFHKLTIFNGWQIEFIPTFNIWIRLSTLLPLIPFFISLPGIIIGSAYRGSPMAKFFGGSQAALSLISAFALLFALPRIDSLGIQNNFQWALLSTILGAHMGNGPWFCLIGLLLLIAGGLIELGDQRLNHSRIEDDF
jgi:hypothetical protein